MRMININVFFNKDNYRIVDVIGLQHIYSLQRLLKPYFRVTTYPDYIINNK